MSQRAVQSVPPPVSSPSVRRARSTREEPAILGQAFREEAIGRLLISAAVQDPETGMHARRVGLLTRLLARVLGWSESGAEQINSAAILHDIGKIGIPAEVINKPGPLTASEFETLKQHTIVGASLLSGYRDPTLRLARDVALMHHEWWDGSGYPYGLRGDEISTAPRIVAVADVLDSLTHHRVYRAAFTLDESLRILRRQRGTQFDPVVLDALLDAWRDACEIHERYPDPPLEECHRPPGSDSIEWLATPTSERGLQPEAAKPNPGGLLMHPDDMVFDDRSNPVEDALFDLSERLLADGPPRTGPRGGPASAAITPPLRSRINC